MGRIKDEIEMAKHVLKGHNQDRWDIPGKAPYVQCSCGKTWAL